MDVNRNSTLPVAGGGETLLFGTEWPDVPVEFVQKRVCRCLALLDLIDSHVMMSLQTFSTPADAALERLRVELVSVNQQTLWPEVTALPMLNLIGAVRSCRPLLETVREQAFMLGPASVAVCCALVYLNDELDALVQDPADEAPAVTASAA